MFARQMRCNIIEACGGKRFHFYSIQAKHPSEMRNHLIVSTYLKVTMGNNGIRRDESSYVVVWHVQFGECFSAN